MILVLVCRQDIDFDLDPFMRAKKSPNMDFNIPNEASLIAENRSKEILIKKNIYDFTFFSLFYKSKGQIFCFKFSLNKYNGGKKIRLIKWAKNTQVYNLYFIET